jgi:hypothetical protein
VAWFDPTVAERPDVTTSGVLAVHLAELRAGKVEPSLSAAQQYVENLHQEYLAAKPPTPTTTTPTTTTPTTTTSTTTVPITSIVSPTSTLPPATTTPPPAGTVAPATTAVPATTPPTS